MSKKNFVYFEEKPVGGQLPSKCYHESACIIGRPCLDVALIVNNELVLVERSVIPAKGLWLAGGRIHWDKFENFFQYAALTVHEHFGIKVSQKNMTLLHPRSICLSKRPYPEVLLWVITTISPKTFKKIRLSKIEQNSVVLIRNKNDLTKHFRVHNISKKHRDVFYDLWSELIKKKIIKS